LTACPAADDPSVALTLKDERLQQLLLQIDGAPDREKVHSTWDDARAHPAERPLQQLLCLSFHSTRPAVHALRQAPCQPLILPHCACLPLQALEVALAQEPFQKFADQVLGLIVEEHKP
jgi:hypothetical protein